MHMANPVYHLFRPRGILMMARKTAKIGLRTLDSDGSAASDWPGGAKRAPIPHVSEGAWR